MRRRGAQGRVLLVQHNESGEKYVLKQIPISEKNAAAAVGEVNVLSRLSHPNITTLYDAWRAGSQLNILMEFADGGSLDGWLQDITTDMQKSIEKHLANVFQE